jgi:SAM-dependent methyltransferase
LISGTAPVEALIKPDGLVARLLPCLSPAERSFLDIELRERPFTLYENRLRRLGFSHRERVLDLACGMGQWTLALARQNHAAVGVDKSMPRLMLATALAKDHLVDNVEFCWSRIEALPFESASFDAVFCYGAFMFGRRDETIREFARVLKPDGVLYLNANGWGWYLWRFQRALTGKLPVSHIPGIVMVLMSSIVRAQRNVAYTPAGLKRMLSHDFTIVEEGSEGSIGGGQSLYPARLLGLPGVFEFLCRRR